MAGCIHPTFGIVIFPTWLGAFWGWDSPIHYQLFRLYFGNLRSCPSSPSSSPYMDAELPPPRRVAPGLVPSQPVRPVQSESGGFVLSVLTSVLVWVESWWVMVSLIIFSKLGKDPISMYFLRFMSRRWCLGTPPRMLLLSAFAFTNIFTMESLHLFHPRVPQCPIITYFFFQCPKSPTTPTTPPKGLYQTPPKQLFSIWRKTVTGAKSINQPSESLSRWESLGNLQLSKEWTLGATGLTFPESKTSQVGTGSRFG